MSFFGYIGKLFDTLLEPVYLAQIRNIPKKPEHIAIIMDGNGRWAKKRNLPRKEGHRASIDAVRRTIEACVQLNIPNLSLFAFSTENWKRPEVEIEAIMSLLVEQVNENLPELDRQGIKVKFIGKKDKLPQIAVESFKNAENTTSKNKKMNLYMLVNYSGRQEILQAVNNIAKQNKINSEISEKKFEKYLYAPDALEPDLIIRTSGEKRLSNFYLWQAAYSELYFDPVLWPDFRKSNLYRAILSYSRRKRRYGGLEEF